MKTATSSTPTTTITTTKLRITATPEAINKYLQSPLWNAQQIFKHQGKNGPSLIQIYRRLTKQNY